MEPRKTSEEKSKKMNIESFLDQVDGKLKEFAQKTETLAGRTQLKAHLGLMEVETVWNKRKEEILAAAARLRQAQTKPKAALDDARLELTLGVADAKKAASKLRKRIEMTERNIKKLGLSANDDAKQALNRLKDAYDSIKDKLLH
jgi:hypothetical protein